MHRVELKRSILFINVLFWVNQTINIIVTDCIFFSKHKSHFVSKNRKSEHKNQNALLMHRAINWKYFIDRNGVSV